MFGSAILDVIIGLVFVYLILSLICSAINEYIASLLNKRGKVLVRGIQAMVRDVGLDKTIFDHPLMASYFPHHGTLVKRAEANARWMPGTRWLRRLFTWVFSSRVREARYPSYVSARAFATAFLEQAGYVNELLAREEERRKAAAVASPTIPGGAQSQPSGLPGTQPSATPISTTSVPTATPSAADRSGEVAPATTQATPSGVRPTDPAVPKAVQHADEDPDKAERLAKAKQKLDELMKTFQRDATLDAPFSALNALVGVGGLLPDSEKKTLVDQALVWRNELESVQASVEAWFNNSMDRVSGAYKRHTQAVLFFIGLVVAFALNADTIQIWRRLSADPKLREAVAVQAASSLPRIAQFAAVDTTRHAAQPAAGGPGGNDSATAAQDTSLVRLRQAKAEYDSASALLERTNLDFGWSWEDAQALGLAQRLDTATAKKAQASRIRAEWNDRNKQSRTHADSVNAGKLARAHNPLPTFVYTSIGKAGKWALLAKLLGLLLTTFALSLGAPFWFDTLNKIINIRAAGRAPATAPAPTPADGAKPGDAKP